MAVLALKLAGYAMVSVSCMVKCRAVCGKTLWPELPEEQLPLTSITNGVHTRTWMSNHMAKPAGALSGKSLEGRSRRSQRMAPYRKNSGCGAMAHQAELP